MSYVKRNCHEYNKNLINRGNLFLWIDQKVLNQWIVKKKKRGRPAFSSSVIQAGWFLKTFYRCPFRALQGFINSLTRLIDQEVSSPHYSVFCKRAAEAAALLPKLSKRRPSHLIIDSSGLKIQGEGEWKDRVHRSKTSKSWIKLHLAIDAKTQEITAAVFSLVEGSSKRVKILYADGAYDRKKVREYLHQIDPCIPPRRQGALHSEQSMKSRNDAFLAIRGLGNDEKGFKLWKKLKGYHKRSLVETTFSRLKGFFGNRVLCKKWSHQNSEILFRLHALNRMFQF